MVIVGKFVLGKFVVVGNFIMGKHVVGEMYIGINVDS